MTETFYATTQSFFLGPSIGWVFLFSVRFFSYGFLLFFPFLQPDQVGSHTGHNGTQRTCSRHAVPP